MLAVGYDPARGKFVGSWVGSPMASMFVYEGELDAARRVLTLSTTGPSFEDPAKQTEYQDIHELRDDGTRLLRSQFKDSDGNWQEMMRGVFRRVS